jgi:hypothetical protein
LLRCFAPLLHYSILFNHYVACVVSVYLLSSRYIIAQHLVRSQYSLLCLLFHSLVFSINSLRTYACAVTVLHSQYSLSSFILIFFICCANVTLKCLRLLRNLHFSLTLAQCPRFARMICFANTGATHPSVFALRAKAFATLTRTMLRIYGWLRQHDSLREYIIPSY